MKSLDASISTHGFQIKKIEMHERRMWSSFMGITEALIAFGCPQEFWPSSLLFFNPGVLASFTFVIAHKAVTWLEG